MQLVIQSKVKVLRFPQTLGPKEALHRKVSALVKIKQQQVLERGCDSHSFAASLRWLTAESHKQRLPGDVVLD